MNLDSITLTNNRSISTPLGSVLDWCCFSSSIVWIIDLFAPNEEVIWGKSDFNCASDSGLDSCLAKSTLMSWCGSWELYDQRVLCKIIIYEDYVCTHHNYIFHNTANRYNRLLIYFNKNTRPSEICGTCNTWLISKYTCRCVIIIFMSPIQSTLNKLNRWQSSRVVSKSIQKFMMTYKLVSKRASLNGPSFPDGT